MDHHSQDPENDLSVLEDPSLIELVRAGSSDAFAVLFARYRHAAHRLARYLSNAVDANDIVAESFTQVFHQLREGRGPDESFRAYLFTSIRREAGRRAKAGKRVTPTDDMSRIDRPVPFGDGEYNGFEREIARSAYESLPQRWRMVLWYLDVEGAKPHEVASKLGLKANTVSALAYRAREGLRKAYLEQHVIVPKEQDQNCHDIRPRIAGLVRRTAAKREQVLVEAHLAICSDCRGALRELEQVNHQLGSVTGMVALAFAAPATGGIAAKTTVAVKSMLAMAGSTAAVVATGVVVIQIPAATPAAARPHEVQTVRLKPEQECLRVVPPKPDPEEEAYDEAMAQTVRDFTTSTRPPEPVTPSSNPSGSPQVSVDLDQGTASVSVDPVIDTPVVKAEVDVEVNVDLHEPTTSTVKVEPHVELPVEKTVQSAGTELQRKSAPATEPDPAPEPANDSDGSTEE